VGVRTRRGRASDTPFSWPLPRPVSALVSTDNEQYTNVNSDC